MCIPGDIRARNCALLRNPWLPSIAGQGLRGLCYTASLAMGWFRRLCRCTSRLHSGQQQQGVVDAALNPLSQPAVVPAPSLGVERDDGMYRFVLCFCRSVCLQKLSNTRPCPLHTAAALVGSQVRSCVICGVQIDVGRVSPSTLVAPVSCHSTKCSTAVCYPGVEHWTSNGPRMRHRRLPTLSVTSSFPCCCS
jgi:hypothetical protein